MKTLAIFDFDGTITYKDSLKEFIVYSHGKTKFYKGLLTLSPILVAYKLGVISNHKAKETLISYFFKGWEFKDFKKVASDFSLYQLPKLVKKSALERIEWHKNQSHDVVIVSASMECWLKPWCQENKIDLISTKLEIKNGKLTGKFLTKNCHGIEKVNRLLEKYDLNNYKFIYAYGDSKGDKEILKIANKKFYKYFK